MRSVDQDDLRTVTTEFGAALRRRRRRICRRSSTAATSSSTAADENFDVTTDLIRDANTVLNGQIDSESAFRRFARDLSLFSTTLAGPDQDLRTLIDNGSATPTSCACSWRTTRSSSAS